MTMADRLTASCFAWCAQHAPMMALLSTLKRGAQWRRMRIRENPCSVP
jgi:hypothetical protein